MDVEYRLNHPVTLQQFLDVLAASTLDERRPVDDVTCMQGMLDNSNLTYTAWLGDKLIGIARCLTDFHYATYLSDLAVDQNVQQSGIGKKLVDLCAKHTPDTCKLVLLASPAANAYYPRIGMEQNERCWMLKGNETVSEHSEKQLEKNL